MPFAYYQRLSPRNRAIYRKSAAIRTLALPDVEALLAEVAALEQALAGARTRTIAGAAKRLLGRVAAQLGIRGVDVIRVLEVRPSDAVSELHGLYERDEHGRTRISVWMRTAAKGQVVAFRTFLRTLLHELCHHLDYELYRLADSYHTEGFFARESSLMRQLAPLPEDDDEDDEDAADMPAAQLELPW